MVVLAHRAAQAIFASSPRSPLTPRLFSLILLAAAVSAVDPFSIFTPQPPPTMCAGFLFSWVGGQEPFDLFINPVGSGPPLQQYGGLLGTSFYWSVNISTGTSFVTELTDATGAVSIAQPVTIQFSADSSCLPQSESSSAPTSSTSESRGIIKSATTHSKSSSSSVFVSAPHVSNSPSSPSSATSSLEFSTTSGASTTSPSIPPIPPSPPSPLSTSASHPSDTLSIPTTVSIPVSIPTDKPHKSLSTGTIVGASMGGSVLLALSATTFLCIRRISAKRVRTSRVREIEPYWSSGMLTAEILEKNNDPMPLSERLVVDVSSPSESQLVINPSGVLAAHTSRHGVETIRWNDTSHRFREEALIDRDGGVRLAGGPCVQSVDPEHAVSHVAPSVAPPPYGVY